MGAIQVKASSTQGTQSRLARAQPRARTVVPGEFTPRPRASSTTGAPSTRPKPSSAMLHCEATLAKSPHQPTVSQAHSMQGSPGALSWHACLSRQGRSDRSHFALPLTDLTGKQCHSPLSDCCATCQGEADSSWVQPQAQQEAPPRPTPGLGPRLGLGRWSPPRPTPGLGLNLDLGRWSPPRPTPGPSLNLGLGRNRVLARPRPRPQKEPPPCPTLGSDRPRHRGYIITLPLASSGYGGTRPASHPGSPR
jgi:hypothetical protein